MTQDDLSLVIEKTKHERFRELVDPNHTDYNPSYLAIIEALANQFRGGSVAPVVQVAAPEPRATSPVRKGCGCGGVARLAPTPAMLARKAEIRERLLARKAEIRKRLEGN